jgi:hypothetical protein
MSTYHTRIRQIMANFVTGAVDRETSLTQFEQVLHEHGFLPKSETLDRTITNENFLALLKMAKDQKALPPAPVDPGATAGSVIDQWQHVVPRLANIINNRCPVCMQRVQGVYSSMQDLEGRMVPVDPPRCHSCMMKWVEKMMNTPIAPAEKPSFSLDDSLVKPLDSAEMEWFKDLEQQMDEFKP